MIANCGALGIDWARVSLSAYTEALIAHNAAFEDKGDDKREVSDWLRKAVSSGVWEAKGNA